MKKVWGRFAALVVVLAAVLVAAPAQSLAGDQLTGSVTIQGDTETPPYYFVTFIRAGGGSGEGFHTATFSTDVSHLPAGDYVVRFKLEMMDSALRYYVAGDPGGSPDAADATIVTLGIGASLPTINLLMQPMATLTGRVTDAGGNGVSGATVEIDRIPPWGSYHRTTTDTQGNYDLGYVQAGERRVEVVGREDLAGAQRSLGAAPPSSDFASANTPFCTRSTTGSSGSTSSTQAEADEATDTGSEGAQRQSAVLVAPGLRS